MTGAPTGGRRGGRRARLEARLEARATQKVDRKPFIKRRLGTFNVLDEEGLELIERNADELLEEIGMEFVDDPEILDIFRDAGADVTS